MKKILLILIVLATTVSSCKKKADPVLGCTDSNSLNFNSEATEDDGTCEYIEQVNKAAYVHFTEDWCGPCGKYGGPTFDSCVKTLEGGSITCMKVYQGSNNHTLENSYATLMENASNYNITAIPTMYVNSLTSGVKTNIGTNFNWVKTQAKNFAAQPVVAGVHVSKTLDGSTMNVTANVKFFNAIPAGKDYRLSMYVLEDNVIAKQTVSGSPDVLNYVHRNVWRASNAANYKGEKLNSSAAIEANQRFDQSASISLLSTWNTSNLKVIAIIWEVPTTGMPKVVNSNIAK